MSPFPMFPRYEDVDRESDRMCGEPAQNGDWLRSLYWITENQPDVTVRWGTVVTPKLSVGIGATLHVVAVEDDRGPLGYMKVYLPAMSADLAEWFDRCALVNVPLHPLPVAVARLVGAPC